MAVAGQTIRDVPLSSLGISILAVSRGGRIYYEPEPNFRLFPADRLLLMGPPSGLKDAEGILNRIEGPDQAEDFDRFSIAEIEVSADSDIAGRTLSDLQFRQSCGATLVGIRRGKKQITNINPSMHLEAGDRLIVIGKAEAITDLKKEAPL
ncbi:MAG: TrkA C-terminal domain-containing protein [Desulfobacterales bacterium]